MQSGPGPHEQTAQKLAADGSDDWREGSFKLLVGGCGFMPSSREAPAKPATVEIALCRNVRREPMVSFPSAFRVCRSQAHGKPVIGLGELRTGFLTHF